MTKRGRPDEQIDFTSADRAGVLGVLRELGEAGHGWVNVRPVVDEEDLPPQPSLPAMLFSAKNPVPLPIGTWVPGPIDKQGRPQPGSLGIAHPVGKKVATRLVEAGLRPPPDWRGVQDNPRRGMVVEVPAGTDVEAVLDWMLAVIDHLSTVELTGDWRADVHR